MASTRVIITVTGHATREFAPNRCAVHLRVASDGPSREAAADQSSTAIHALTALLTTLDQLADGPLRRWSLDQVQHSRHRPYSQDGSVQPWLYQSSAGLVATFSGLDAVGQFVDDAAEIAGVEVGHLQWKLTRTARAKAQSRVRKLALHDATAKADAYANGLGLKAMHVIALADPGMLGVSSNPTPQMGQARMMMASDSMPAGDGPNLRPERLRVAVDVDARFEATT
ncbi:SIMPL domain-containing protein [Tomitella biformata]|uniref:SIMPL domain-containing protein n=1 Tax=Tomitella biformata TaxID=630403 RepID=UPI0004656D7F|nr:SIMPL domain-containing protein [Tomitella biformata]